ncbi:uncharacterized protein MELLADRAFT_89953 [Melampsora larici-populina 98AG31]|uniref:Uncharacterized protein n=1 Tax=Melampsora larici-populina (strain 98AG31 / pathotype 3-4-7) TaxID=747676 RepID=F4RV79_MELLP|nr:uncharacterized protein MELLADRAFT_89953 [Melampsora larici-populina 98AG31]EGG03714.1 hypothetical protein MELLADRAFT_89953 [Melampsora larici-populina 98AG31]
MISDQSRQSRSRTSYQNKRYQYLQRTFSILKSTIPSNKVRRRNTCHGGNQTAQEELEARRLDEAVAVDNKTIAVM